MTVPRKDSHTPADCPLNERVLRAEFSNTAVKERLDIITNDLKEIKQCIKGTNNISGVWMRLDRLERRLAGWTKTWWIVIGAVVGLVGRVFWITFNKGK